MQTKITIRNEAQTCYIDIEGTIGVEGDHDAGKSSVATYEAFRREVERIKQVAAQHIVVNIRSTGGDVNDALLIYDALCSLDAHVTTRCYGYTASAATIIAQAANEGCREISSNAMYLIHRSMCSIEGNVHELEARAELLRKTDERLAQLYALHSGGDASEYAALMAENNGEGRWLTAQEAIQAGLADTIIDATAPGVQPTEPDKTDEVQSPMPSAAAKPKTDLPRPVKRAMNVAIGELLRYLFSRLSSRLGDWFEGGTERKGKGKRHAKRDEKYHQHQSEEPDAETTVEEPAQHEESVTAGEVKAVSDTAQRHSAVAFDEGQRRFKSTTLKAVEDPLMSPNNLHTNQQAYIDDVKAFSR